MFSQDVRSKTQYKNILLSFLYKGISVISSFAIVPLSLNFLTKEVYGIWITIYSIIGWTALFDLGLGNGMKNKLSEALAKDDFIAAKKVISTGYIVLLQLICVLVLIFSIISYFVDWNKILGVTSNNFYINKLIYVCFVLFALKIFTDLIYVVLMAHQKVSYSNLINCISNVLVLASIFVLKNFISVRENSRLLILGLTVSVIPVLISGGFNIFLFKTKYKKLLPQKSFFDQQYVKQILALGGNFFIIQIAVILIFSTDNILISRLFGAETVTTYNIAYKLFSGFTIVWTIVLTPYWTAFNDAYVKDDINWIKKTVRMLLYLWLGIALALLVTVIFSNYIYQLWVGPNIHIPIQLSLFMAIFILISTYSNIFAYFLNGLGKIRIQLYCSILAGTINIPIAIILAKHFSLGLSGIILAIIISLLPGAILETIQYVKIINKTSQCRIWYK